MPIFWMWGLLTLWGCLLRVEWLGGKEEDGKGGSSLVLGLYGLCLCTLPGNCLFIVGSEAYLCWQEQRRYDTMPFSRLSYLFQDVFVLLWLLSLWEIP